MIVRGLSAYVTEITDDFNRSNRDLVDDGYVRITDGTFTSNQMVISGNQVHRGGQTTSNDPTDVYVHPVSLSGLWQWAEASFGAMATSSGEPGHLLLRGDGTTQDTSQGVYFQVWSGGWAVGVDTMGDGANVAVQFSGSISGTSGKLRAEIDPNDVASVYWNDVFQGSGAVTGAPAGLRIGFSPDSRDAPPFLDNFRAGTIRPASRTMLQHIQRASLY